jgi:hypothetical protein
MEDKKVTQDQAIEVTVFGIAFTLALILRFVHLGALPLGDTEAANALVAMKMANGQAVTMNGQPGYAALTSILFFLFNANNFLARFWPAVFGSLAVFLPLLFKRWTGRTAALGMALFLAIDPAVNALSRTATGTILGLVCLVAALGFILNKKWLWAGIACALTLLAGSSMWIGVFSLILAWLLYHLIYRKIKTSDTGEEITSQLAVKWVDFFSAFLTVFLLVGTVFSFRAFTITGFGNSLAAYFSQWTQSGSNLIVMFIALFSAEILTILLALWGAIHPGQEENAGFRAFAGVWSLLALALILVNPGRQVNDWMWLLPGLWGLMALGIDRFWHYFHPDELLLKLFQGIATITLLVFCFLNILSTAAGIQATAFSSLNWLYILVPVLLLVVVTGLISWGWSAPAAKEGLLAGMAILLIVLTFGTAWKSGGLGSRPETELWREDALPTGSHWVVQTVGDLSTWNAKNQYAIDVALLNEASPSVEWALRDYPNILTLEYMDSSSTPSLIISPDTVTVTQTTLYRGQSLVWASASDFEKMTVRDWVKWFGYRKVPELETKIFLWARTDLFKGS